MTGARLGDRLATWAITAMILIVPLIYATDMYAYTLLPKRMVFALCVVVAAIGWLVTILQEKETLTASLPAICLGVFCGLAVLSLVNVTNVTVAIVELTFFLTLAGLFYIGTRASGVSVDHWTIAIMLAGAVVSVIGILQYHGLAFTRIPSNGQPSATFGYRNFAAMFLVAVIPTCLFRFWLTNRKGILILSAVSGVLSGIFLLYTRTRGAWLGTGVGLLAATAAMLARPESRVAAREAWLNSGSLKSVLIAVALLSIIVAGRMAPGFTDTGLQRFDEKKADLSTTVTSVLSASGDRGRLLMWQRSLPLLWDHLLTGTGPGHWEFAYPRYDKGAMIRPDSAPKRPHNDFIWIAAEHGTPALLAYLAFLATVLIAGWRALIGSDRQSRQYPVISIAVVVGVCVHAMFSFPKEQPQIALLFFLLAGIACRGASGRSIPAQPITIAVLMTASVGSYVTWQHIAFDRHYLTALIAEDDERWSDMETAARSGLAYGPYRPHMYVIYGRALEKSGRLDDAGRAYADALEIFPDSWHAHNGSGIIKKRKGDHEGAMLHYERALTIHPGAMSVRTNLGALYRAMGNDDRAEAQFRHVLKSLPDDPGANNNLGNILRARGELDSAEVYYRRVLEQDPSFPQANQNLGDLLMSRGEYTQAIEHFVRALEARPGRALTLWSLASAYENTGQVGVAERYYREAMVADPSFPRSYFSLATMLYGLHRWQESIDLFEQFLTIWKGDPKFRTFAEGRIQNSRDWIKRMEKK